MITKKLKQNIKANVIVDMGQNFEGEIEQLKIVSQQNSSNIAINKQDISTNKQEIEGIKQKVSTLNPLQAGDNIELTNVDNTTTINTKDNLLLNALEGRNGTISINSPTYINSTLNIKESLLEKQQQDFYFFNTQGQIFFTDINGRLSVRQVKNELDNVINELKKYKPFKYRGEWKQDETYNINDLVSSGSKEYLSIKDGNAEPLTSKSAWLEIGYGAIGADLDDYYNKQQIDTKLLDYATSAELSQVSEIANTNQTSVAELQTSLANNYVDKNTITTTYATKQELTNATNNVAKKNEKNIFSKQQNIYGDEQENYPGLNIKSYNQKDSAINMYTNNTSNHGTIQNKAGGFLYIRNVATPTNNNDAANKQYVDNKIESIKPTDLTNYYTKSESDSKFALISSVTTNSEAIEQIEQELNGVAKIGLDNIFTANNTFNNPIVVGAPTDNTHATTKEYVDTQIATIPSPDLTNYAKTNDTNTFTANQYVKGATLSKFALRNNANKDVFSMEVTTSGNQGVIKNNAGGTIRYWNAADPKNDTDCANKKYVDTLNAGVVASIENIENTFSRLIGTNSSAIGTIQGDLQTFKETAATKEYVDSKLTQLFQEIQMLKSKLK